jgi:hypothetical protein
VNVLVWAVAIGVTALICRDLWRSRRDAEVRRRMAAGLAADLLPDPPGGDLGAGIDHHAHDGWNDSGPDFGGCDGGGGGGGEAD